MHTNRLVSTAFTSVHCLISFRLVRHVWGRGDLPTFFRTLLVVLLQDSVLAMLTI